MLFSSQNGWRPNDQQWASRQSFRPMLEMLEDRITPSNIATIPPPMPSPTNSAAVTTIASSSATQNATVAQSNAQTSNQLTFTFSPARLIYVAGATAVNLAVTLTNPTTGTPVSGGTVTFTVTDTKGNTVGTPVTVNVPSTGEAATATTNQITATYPIPATLPANAYTVTAVYNQSGSPFDGSTGSEILTVVLPPAPAQHVTLTQTTTTPTPQVQSQPVLSLQQAAFTLYIDGVERAWDTFLHRPTDAVQASINAALPYAGPWGTLFELAGEMAFYQTVQGIPM